MGNRATITFEPYYKSSPCIYVHWNGNKQSVEAFCEAARTLKYRDPSSDPSYAFARFTGLLAVFYGLDNDIYLGVGTNKELNSAGDDNGVYVLGEDWDIVERRDVHGRLLDMTSCDPAIDQGYVDEMAEEIVDAVRAAAHAARPRED